MTELRAKIERLEGELHSVHAHLRHYHQLVDGLRADVARLIEERDTARTAYEQVRLQARPVAFRLKVGASYMIFKDEEQVAFVAEKLGITGDYQGLYLRAGEKE